MDSNSVICGFLGQWSLNEYHRSLYCNCPHLILPKIEKVAIGVRNLIKKHRLRTPIATFYL